MAASPEQTYSQEANEALYDKLRDIALVHVERSNGELSILDHDYLNRYPAQALGRFVIEGQLQPPAMIDFIGKKAMPDFVNQSQGLLDGEPPVREETERLLRKEQSIIIATDHDDVTSPAYALGGFTGSLRKKNAERDDEEKLDFESGIIVSKMLSLLAYEVDGSSVPCIQVLQMMCDRVYLSYPPSKTFLESGIAEALPPNHIPDHNDALKADIDTWLLRGGVILGESLLGSTHKPQAYENVHALPRVTKGSADMVTRDHIHLLPVIVGLTEEDRYMQKVGPIQQLKTLEDAHALSEQMAVARTERNRARGSQVICVYQTAEQAEEERRRL